MNKFSLSLNANITTKTYSVSANPEYKLPDGFLVDIVTMPDTFEAYVYHKDYGTKNLIFEISKDDIDYDSFVSMVNDNISFSIDIYTEDIMN